MTMADVAINRESPRQDEVVRLIGELDAHLSSLYPAESNHMLDIDSLDRPDMRFFVARRDGVAIGCGAMRVDAEGYGEVKRMYVAPAARGGRIGQRLLERIAEQARAEGLTALRLETGVHQADALALYRKLGFVDRGPFGPYGPDPLSVFMEKVA